MEVNLASRGHGQAVAVSSPLVSLHLDIKVTFFDQASLIALDSDHVLCPENVFFQG